MPDQLPSLTAQKVVKALIKCGLIEDRQRGNHLVLVNDGTNRRAAILMHKGHDNKEPIIAQDYSTGSRPNDYGISRVTATV